ncbi:galactokinase [Pseudonocardiaceae bacterium YIM PH 21723]|nr:galactokinase [Pseudonocardiaceae bacterium YIM PH 21723]
MNNTANQAVRTFEELHGHTPHGVWSAPGRVNLIGEHTDYNDGLVLPLAIPQRTQVAASPRTDGLLTLASIGRDTLVAEPLRVADLRPGSVTGWPAYPAGVAWVLAERGLSTGGADLVISGDVPTGAGLSSSAALECVVALTLTGLAGVELPLGELARIAQRAENDFVGVPCGILDQTASLSCTDGHALFYDVRSGQAEQVPLDMAAAGLSLLVIDTRVQHALGETGYGDRRRGCEKAAVELRVPSLRSIEPADLASSLDRLPAELVPLVRHVVTENARVDTVVRLLRAGRVAEIGDALTASHVSLRDDYRVSCAELDLAVDAALAAGALGSRMTGGGFGGSAIALVPADARQAVSAAVAQAFADRDLAEPRQFTVLASAGAGRDD